MKKIPIFHTFLIFLTVIATFTYFTSEKPLYGNCHTKRYVFDIGSGTLKAKGYLVDTCNNVIVKHLDSYHEELALQQCINSASGPDTIHSKCLDNLPKTITKLKDKLEISCQDSSCTAIATAWARNIKNPEIITNFFKDKYNINTEVISQEQEGQLAFHSTILDSNLNNEEILVWDMGGGSFQLSAFYKGEITVYNGPYGTANFLDKLLTYYQGDNHNFDENKELAVYNKHSLEEIIEFGKEVIAKPLIKSRFYSKASPHTKSINLAVGELFNYGLAKDLKLGNTITKQQILDTIKEVARLDNKTIAARYSMPKAYAVYTKSALMLTYIIMDTLNIDKVKIINNKITDHVAIDAKYWS